jgi:hypothetical protein
MAKGTNQPRRGGRLLGGLASLDLSGRGRETARGARAKLRSDPSSDRTVGQRTASTVPLRRLSFGASKGFVGPLAEPIIRPNALALALALYGNDGGAISEAADTWVFRQQFDKLLLLARMFNVDVSESHGWALLCFRLAETCVPGCQVVDAPKKRRGRPKGTGAINLSDLFVAIQRSVAIEGCSISEACRRLARDRKGPWKGMNPDSLEARYWEYLREQEKALRAPQPAWADEIQAIVAAQKEGKGRP